jgi:predicted amidohydrolase
MPAGPLPIAAAQPRCAAADVSANARAHAAAIREARARVVVFPELSLTGYELDAAPVAAAALAPVVEACAETGSVALVGAPVEEDGRRSIAAFRVDAGGAAVAYRKTHLGGDEPARFSPGDGPAVITVDGWRIGLAICKDTGVDEHTAATAALGVDLYAAGVVHHRHQIEEQDARGRRIAAACGAYVAFASFAGPTGGGYDVTAGTSTVWAPDGGVLARAGVEPGEIARAVLDPAGALTRG